MGTGFLFSDGSYLDMTELSKLLGAHSDVEIRVWIVGCKTYNLDGYFTQQNQLGHRCQSEPAWKSSKGSTRS
eukprot:m.14315 g.14315  ORF g.14315 m.14315 type:complete len:72 (-) comp4774_c0_seq1:495-710(-)